MAALVLALVACGARTDESVAPAPPARSNTPTESAPTGEVLTGTQQLEAAKAKGLFFVGLFFDEADAVVKDAETSLKLAVEAGEGRAAYGRVDLSLSGQAAIIRDLDLARLPMPVALVVAPSGAVTKTFVIKDSTSVDPQEVLAGFVTPAHAEVLAAFQEGKLVVVDLRPALPAASRPMDPLVGIDALFNDKEASANLVRVTMDAEDPREKAFLAQFKGEAMSLPPTLLVLAPPGKEVGRLSGAVTKDGILAIVSKYAAP